MGTLDGAGRPVSEGNIFCGGSVKAKFNRCMAEHGGNTDAVHLRANVAHMCKDIILYDFILNEQAAQRQYDEAEELFPKNEADIREIKHDESDHECKFRAIKAAGSF
jgi:hypothetical protein